MRKRVLKMIPFVLEFFLDPVKDFLIDDRRIESRNLNWLSLTTALVSIVIEHTNIGAIAQRSRDKYDPETMALVCAMSFAVKGHSNGFVPHPPIIKLEDPLHDGRCLFIHHRPTDDSGPFVAFLSINDFLSVAKGRAKDQVALKRALFKALHDFTG